MTDRRDDDFRVRPSAPKNRGKGQGQSFVSKVLKQAGKASSGKSAVRRPGAAGTGQRPGSRLGRGHTAARFAGATLTPMSRRVTIKTLLVNHQRASPQSLAKHLRYIERDGVGRDGESGRAYGPQTDEADLGAFKERAADDRHHFRFIVSPEDGGELDDLRTYTRHLVNRMEADLGTRLDWVAVDHWNTDNPHTHLIVRGRDDTGKDLIIAGDYIAHGFRHRAAELVTEWLGPRTELEIQQTLGREVEQERWTSLDRTLQREADDDGRVRIERFNEPRLQRQRLLLIGRLQRLQRLGLADEVQPGTWVVHADAEKTLRALGERGDIIRTMQRAMSGQPRELAVFEPGDDGRTVIGRVVAKGLADELHDRGYLVVDGTDGKAHYVALNARDELANYPTGAVVEIRGSAEVRAADKNIATLASDGLYRTDHHLAIEQGRAKPGRDPQEVVASHVRRLEALRRAGIVERVTEGLWKVPDDLAERGRQYDAQRLGGVAVEMKSHLPIERQARVIGATWLDQQLIGGGRGLGDLGFGGDAKQAMQQRAVFLEEQGLAQRRGQRVILARNLLGTLRNRELAQAAKEIAAETGLEHRPVADGQRVAGIYRRSVMLGSGRYAMLDDGMGFSLVPWRPVIEQRLGQQLVATVRGGGVSWEIGKQRGPQI
ncbi:relaxase/mobilization nuclease domain-containing protein [Kerstersia gyiorum]|jgi:type IV secretory pathway VirD2 relaxase|uniref:relaxase/mobilization nuclease domain-containing protein n=1 Tax=Kerstersia gyiorum TaxID=206506 RepID=UPI003B43CA0C